MLLSLLLVVVVAQRKAHQTPAGRSSSRSKQTGPPAAQTGLYPVLTVCFSIAFIFFTSYHQLFLQFCFT